MIKTKTHACTIVVMLAMTVGAFAQGTDATTLTESELADARALIQAGRQEVIRQELRLGEEEAAAFWPLYDEYRQEILVDQDRHATLISDYLARYREGNLTDDYADDLIDDYFDIQGDLLRTRKKYVRRFQRILPSLKVALFYQLENKLNADIDAQLALVVPLVEAN